MRLLAEGGDYCPGAQCSSAGTPRYQRFVAQILASSSYTRVDPATCSGRLVLEFETVRHPLVGVVIALFPDERVDAHGLAQVLQLNPGHQRNTRQPVAPIPEASGGRSGYRQAGFGVGYGRGSTARTRSGV